MRICSMLIESTCRCICLMIFELNVLKFLLDDWNDL